jgi:hypothetical protein
VSFDAIILCVVSQKVFVVDVAVQFVIDSVRVLLDTPSYICYNHANVYLANVFSASLPAYWSVRGLIG